MKSQTFLTGLIVIVLAICFVGFTSKSDSESGILTMRVFENYDSGITIVDENGVIEQVKLPAKFNNSSNVATINKTINLIVARGYKLQSSSQAGSPGVFVTTFIFSR